MRALLSLFALVAMLGGCAQARLTGIERGQIVPYLAVWTPVSQGQGRIHLTAAIPGTIRIVHGCVVFERLDGAIVLPVFETGTRAGVDRNGPWVFDPYSRAYFRDGSAIRAGGGGGGTLGELTGRHVLTDRVPERCVVTLTADMAVPLNPGIDHAPSGA